MISSDVIRGYNDTIVLSLLLDKDSYGYEISKNIRTITNEQYIIKETTLYSTFSRLEKNGFIKSYVGDETHGRQRTYYHITKSGEQYYWEKCAEWEVTQDVVSKFCRRRSLNDEKENINGND